MALTRHQNTEDCVCAKWDLMLMCVSQTMLYIASPKVAHPKGLCLAYYSEYW